MNYSVFPFQNGLGYCVCRELSDGTMDPHFDAIDVEHKGTAVTIAKALRNAYMVGQSAKAREIRNALGV